MTDELRAKITKALETPNVPLQLTPAESAELDAYVALVSYFSQQLGNNDTLLKHKREA